MPRLAANDLPSVWGGGQLLAFSALDGATDYENGLTARTSVAGAGVRVMLPGDLELRFDGRAPLSAVVAGDFFDLATAGGRVRGVFPDTCHLLIDGPVAMGEVPATLAVKRKGARTLVGAAARFDAARVDADLDAAIRERRRWLEARSVPDGLTGGRRRAFVKALSIMKTQVMSAEGRIRRRWTTPDRWPHRAMWLWDSAFHAVGWRHVDVALAREMLEAVMDGQLPDGMVPHMISPMRSSDVTQPPVLAMAAELVDRTAPDAEWLARLYPALCRYVRWDMANRDTDGDGLLEWKVETNPVCRCGESGLDNSPRFDKHDYLNAVDFNAFLARECQALAAIAARLGLKADAAEWTETSRRVCARINERLWDEQTGLYLDRPCGGERLPILAATGFLPLICGAPSAAQAQRLAAHLDDPKTFGVGLPVATVAPRTSPDYSKDMWRGPVWANLNWLIAGGFERCGQPEAARRIRERTLDEIARWYDRCGSIFEYYDDESKVAPPDLLRKGRCDPSNPYRQVVHDYGWTATLFVDMAMAGAATS